jgi:hypothetical protein
MCHACLKRLFTLSINDPAHMPPKCCTSTPIPLPLVDKLFSLAFKKRWNQKYDEFRTKQRVYCPERKCGEWIRPEIIKREQGRKVGICAKCKGKVCVGCGGKWHGKKECPQDEGVLRLREKAKQEGWQSCWKCHALVELKEGCNHM